MHVMHFSWEDKSHHSEPLTLPSSFSQIYMLSMTSYDMEYPFGHWGSAVPAVSLPNVLSTYSLLPGGVV